MKRISTLILAFVMLVSIGFAQKGSITRAKTSMDAQRFADAKQAIDEATEDETTKDLSLTWLTRGQVYQYINRDLLGKQHLDLDSNALMKSYEAYLKAIKLGENEMAVKAAEKGKAPKPYKDKNVIVDNLRDFIAPEFKRKGIEYYQLGNYKNALEMFELGIAIDVMPEINKKDTTFIYYSAILATELKSYEKAVKYFKQAQELNYGVNMPELDENGAPKKGTDGKLITSSKTAADIALSLGNIYIAIGDTATGLKTYEDGLKKYKENTQILTQIINFYLTTNNVEKANAYLDEALKEEPNNPTYNFAKGTLYDQLAMAPSTSKADKESHLKTAIKFYEISLTNKPDYINPLYNMGVIYYNQAAAVLDQARDIPLSNEKEYNAKVAEAKVLFEKALPYFEKVLAIEPNESGAISSLMVIYQQLGKQDKVKEMEEKLK